MKTSKKTEKKIEFQFHVKVKGSYYSNGSKWDNNSILPQIKDYIRYVLRNDAGCYIDFEDESGETSCTNKITYSTPKKS
jgi:hypothetical protein